MNKKVIIIGSGPAGYTAAIYAARAGLNPLVIAGIKHGGQLMDTTSVDNFPGYKDGIMGPDMMEDIRHQAIRFGSDIIYEDVTKVDFSTKPFRIYIDKEEFTSDSVIISTGAQTKYLGLESEKKYSGYGVSSCATCDGFFYKDMDVVVIGGGDTACEEALYLSNICKTVTMLVRTDKMRASFVMQERVKGKDNINIHKHVKIVEIIGDKNVTGVEVEHTIKHGEYMEHKIFLCQGVFIAIGHKPNSFLFKSYLEMDSEGYILTQPGTTKTNIDGIFACGDVQDRIYRQAITSAGTGCMAALDVEKYLSK